MRTRTAERIPMHPDDVRELEEKGLICKGCGAFSYQFPVMINGFCSAECALDREERDKQDSKSGTDVLPNLRT